MYEYDRGGNILSKKRYAYSTAAIANTTTPLETVPFTYTNANWKDQLTAFNGKPISYDGSGNPIQFGANTDADKITYEWEKGRQLKSVNKAGTAVSFKYNENGLRIQKTVNSVVTNYTLHGKNIVHMTQGSNNLHFYYDASGKPAMVDFNGVMYGYVHNLQGDIVAIVNGSGAVVVRYTYDAWGKPLSKTGTLASTLGTLNPFRYRGYVYDEETGLYYLRSRYYDCVRCRFHNTDLLIDCSSSVGGKSSFCYCANHPVMDVDPDGYLKLSEYHNAVQKHAANALGGMEAGVYTEIGFFVWGDTDRIGRADIVNFKTGEIWEVKPHMASFYRDPEAFYWDTQMQLLGYIYGSIRSDKRKGYLSAAKFKRGRSIKGCTWVGNKKVTYWCERNNGIVWYNVIDPPNDDDSTNKHSNDNRGNNNMSDGSALMAGFALFGLAMMIRNKAYSDDVPVLDGCW